MYAFSVVIATFNRKDLLAACLDSLCNQTFSSDQYEIIVVDDGSTDGTIEYLHSLSPTVSLSVIQIDHSGSPAVARNKGIQAAQGDVVAMTDDDCVPPRNWLEQIADGFARHPEVSAVTGYQEAASNLLQTNLIAKYERYQTRDVYGARNEEVVGGWDVPAGVTNNVAIKRSVLLEVNGFDENFPVPAGEDADLKKRITDKGHLFLYLPLKVEHRQEYSLKRFLRQQFIRGIGSVYFDAKWQQSNGRDYLLPLRWPLRFVRTLVKSHSISFALLELIGSVWFFRGMIGGSSR